MNIFVLCTGRSGSVTLTKACQHITNFTSDHESRASMIRGDRLDYPENHIEADNRLSWILGRLDEKYGDNAKYVHLIRDDNKVAKSFTNRYDRGIIKAYRNDGIILNLPSDTDPFAVGLDYCETINTNIKLFLKDKSHQMIFDIDQATEDFKAFWEFIGAEGDFDAAVSELEVRHNATKSGLTESWRLFKWRIKKIVTTQLLNW